VVLTRRTSRESPIEQHAALLEKLGIDPGELVQRAAERAIG